MPNPRVAKTLAYLSGLLSSSSFVLMVLQIFGKMPIGLAMYTALGAVVATVIWLAMWTVSKVHDMLAEQTATLAARFAEAPTSEIKIPTPRVKSTPVSVAVSARPIWEGETFQRRPTLSSIPAALLGQIFRLGIEGEKKRRETP